MAISRMQEPRQLYGLGSLVKSIGKTVKKVVKSDLGKAALLAAVGFGIPGTSIGGLLGRASFGGAAPGEGDVNLNIIGNEVHKVGNDLLFTVSNDITLNAGNDMVLFALDNMGVATASGIMSIKAPTMDLRSTLTTTIQAGTSMDIEALTGIDILSTTGSIDITTFIGNVDINTLAGVIELN